MRRILPRVVCEACGRSIAVVSAGTPRAHQVDGVPCPGSGNASGTCGVCGRVAPLEPDGTVRRHREMRVRRSKRHSPDGWVVAEPEMYTSTVDCAGAGQMPEVADVVP
jgi:hypothetical protein